MSRLFDGVDDQMVYGTPPALTGNLTMLIVARIMVVADTTWMSFIETETSPSTARVALGRRNTGNIYMSNGASAQDAVAITDSDGWCVIAVTKATGTVAPRMHKCIIGGANTHTNAGGTLANETAGNTIRIGGNDDFANIRVAAAALFTSVLSDAAIEGIASAKTTQSIADLSPAWLVDDSDAFATDLIAANDRTSITGTADDADDPAGWVYGLGGAPQSVTATPATETDVAQTVTFAKPIFKSLTPAAETAAAQAVAFSQAHSFTLGAALETDVAPAFAVTKAIFKAVGVANESDAAAAVLAARALGIVPAPETDMSVASTFAKAATLVPVVEADQATGLSRVKVATLIPATELDLAVALSIGGPKTLAPATESDVVMPLSFAKPVAVTLAPAAELALAVALAAARTRALGPAAETDSALAVAFTKALARTLAPAAEFDAAEPLGFLKPMFVMLVPVDELDAAVVLVRTGGVAPPVLLSPLRALFVDRTGARPLDDFAVAMLDGPGGMREARS